MPPSGAARQGVVENEAINWFPGWAPIRLNQKLHNPMNLAAPSRDKDV
jgi:hypothetical protein